ncbi:MAG: triphosphoribosyl-dephospho-CoA synthase CitG [Spirochaetes bacterium]|nr:triphosphoribosyl-dephospho-CoA synthase CitG [Spirochaetota bacterium]
MKGMIEERTLWSLLEARDRRQRLREYLLVQYGCPLVQVSPINPGARKNTPYALMVQDLAEEAVRHTLRKEGFAILHEEGAREETGPWALYVILGEANRIKKSLIQLEESHPLGRLFDLDVIDPKGIPLSRRMLGCPERRCIVCGGPVSSCIRNSTHTVDRVWKTATERVETYFYHLKGYDHKTPDKSTIAASIAALCEKALREEVELSPKPGLVDKEDPGAHSDMGLYTFYRSIVAIVPYLKESVQAGWNTCQIPLIDVLPMVRQIGIDAERAMFAATGGVNTHKGAIFSLGILCLAVGRLSGLGLEPTVPRLMRTVRGLCQGLVEKELKQDAGILQTKGWRAYKQYGVKGARGEAEQGFPRVRFFALPLLKLLTFLFPTQRTQSLLTVLLGLMVMVKDTNILGRGGLGGLRWVRLSALRVILRGGAFTDTGMRLLRIFREDCKARHLSPGGSADLLAVTIFLHSLASGQKNRFHG